MMRGWQLLLEAEVKGVKRSCAPLTSFEQYSQTAQPPKTGFRVLACASWQIATTGRWQVIGFVKTIFIVKQKKGLGK
jgi:hypothetical protein